MTDEFMRYPTINSKLAHGKTGNGQLMDRKLNTTWQLLLANFWRENPGLWLAVKQEMELWKVLEF